MRALVRHESRLGSIEDGDVQHTHAPDSIRDDFFTLVRARELRAQRMEKMRLEDAAAREHRRVEVERAAAEVRTRPLAMPESLRLWHVHSESPNALHNLLGTQVRLACNLVKAKAIKRPRRLCREPWDGSVVAPALTAAPRKQAVTERGPKTRRKRLRPTGQGETTRRERAKRTLPPLPSAKTPVPLAEGEEWPSGAAPSQGGAPSPQLMTTTTTERELDLEIARWIVIREDLLAFLRRGLPAALDREDVEATLADLRKVGLRVVECLGRWRRAQPLEGEQASKKCRSARSGDVERPLSPASLAIKADASAVRFEWKGVNYLHKMANDLNDLDELVSAALGPNAGAPSLRRNPLLLGVSLDELAALVDSLGLVHPQAEMWKAARAAGPPELLTSDADLHERTEAYTAAYRIIQEEKQVTPSQVDEQEPARAPASEADNEESPRAVLRAIMGEEIARVARHKGCWKSRRLAPPIERAPDSFKSPAVLSRARLRFRERIAEIERARARRPSADPALLEEAARRIQRRVRVFLATRRQTVVKRQRRVVVRVQSMLRGALARQQTRARGLERIDSMRIEPVKRWLVGAETAALRVQCWQRQRAARAMVQRVREYANATRIQAWYRSRKQWHDYRLYIAVRALQKVARGRIARHYAAAMRLDKSQRAGAIKVQRMFRQVQAEREVRKIRFNNAATKLQVHVRGKLAKNMLFRITCARRVQARVRQLLARRELARRRRLMHAVKRVQRWRRLNNVVSQAVAHNKLVQWRRAHQSRHRRYPEGVDPEARRGVSFHLCGLYDRLAVLERKVALLRRTEPAKAALARLDARLDALRARRAGGHPRSPALTALVRVRKKYTHLLHKTNHLTDAERLELQRDTEAALAAVRGNVALVEKLARESMDAQAYAAKAKNVVDPESYLKVMDPRQFAAFEREYAQSKHRKNVLERLDDQAAAAAARVGVALRTAEWSQQGALQADREAQSRVSGIVRKREAAACARQLVAHISAGGRGFKRAALRRVHRAEELAQREAQARDRAGMEAEDAHALVHRPYLAASRDTLGKIRAKFAAFDPRGTGELGPAAFQRLAFDMGVAVGMAKVRQHFANADADGNNRVDFDEYCLWFLCHSEADRARFVPELTRGAVAESLHTSALTITLRVDQGARRLRGVLGRRR